LLDQVVFYSATNFGKVSLLFTYCSRPRCNRGAALRLLPLY